MLLQLWFREIPGIREDKPIKMNLIHQGKYMQLKRRRRVKFGFGRNNRPNHTWLCFPLSDHMISCLTMMIGHRNV